MRKLGLSSTIRPALRMSIVAVASQFAMLLGKLITHVPIPGCEALTPEGKGFWGEQLDLSLTLRTFPALTFFRLGWSMSDPFRDLLLTLALVTAFGFSCLVPTLLRPN